MRKFRIQVNGNPYEVEIEEIEASAQPAAPRVIAPSPGPAVAPAPAQPVATAVAPKSAPASASTRGGGRTVIAPMPGVILDVRVKPGDHVDSNTVAVTLEAMKMENEIFAGTTGVVREVSAVKGASVNTGDRLVRIDPA